MILNLLLNRIPARLIPEHFYSVDIGYLPEIWFALLAIVLGTLIIVISIASQNISKLIDLYMRDWFSLIYVWFIIVSTFQVVHAQEARQLYHFVNLYLLFPLAALISFPYVFYILALTKPSNIAQNIKKTIIGEIERTVAFKNSRSMHTSGNISFQKVLFNSLNQLDDLLLYVNSKEVKSHIISIFRSILEVFFSIKSELPPRLFVITPAMRNDISFISMHDTHTLQDTYPYMIERKCLIILRNAYEDMIENNRYELASLCVSEIGAVGKGVSKMRDEELMDIILTEFNTYFRFALKHAIRMKENRNLYNLVFQYQKLLSYFVVHHNTSRVIDGFQYLKYYADESFSNISEANLFIIIDTIAYDMKRILVLVHRQEVDVRIQETLLESFLQLGQTPGFMDARAHEETVIHSKIKVIQTALGLFYMRHDQMGFADKIITGMLEDLEKAGYRETRTYFEKLFEMMKLQKSTFWEATDRGNVNIYFSPDLVVLEDFRRRLFTRL